MDRNSSSGQTLACAALLVFALAGSDATAAKGRLWKSTDGKHELRATLLRADDAQATFEKPDGQRISVPIAQLRGEDGEYIRRWRAEKPVPGIVPDVLGDPVDLLPMVDPAKHMVRGTMRRDGEELVPAPKGRVIFQVPYRMPKQYQLRLVAKRTTPPRTLSVAVPIAGHQGLVVFDSGDGKKSGLVWIDGKNEPSNPTYFRKGAFTTGRDSETVITVHSSHLHAACDGRTIVEWCGDPGRLALDRRFWGNVPDGKLMVSTWIAEYRISKLELRPIEKSESDQYELRGKQPDPGQSVALIEHPAGRGTGFLAAPNLLVTNHHVIEDSMAEDLKVVFPDQNDPLPVHAVLHADAQRDLAVLSIKTSRPPLPIAWDGHFAKDSPVEILGNPSVGGGVTLRNARVKGTVKEMMRIDDVDVIQVDANISPGASGGPMINELGQVVGVTVMKATDEGEQIIREGLRRLDRSLAKQQQEKGVAFAVPGLALAAALDEVRNMPPGEAARVTQTHDSQVIVHRLATLAGIHMLQALANVPDEMYRQAALVRTGKAGSVSLLPPDEAGRIKAALGSPQMTAMVSQIEEQLPDDLRRVAASIHVPPEARRSVNSLFRKVEELKKLSARPGADYRRFSATLGRFEDSVSKLLQQTEQ